MTKISVAPSSGISTPSNESPTARATPPPGAFKAPGLSARTLKSVDWFPRGRTTQAANGVASTFVKIGIGALVGLAFYAAHRPVLAYVVWGIAGGVGVISLASAAARQAIDGALVTFGRWIGTGVGAALLSTIYIVVVTPTRFIRRALGSDDLHLRDRDRLSYWLQADSATRTKRWVGAMFATEALGTRRGHPLRNALLVLVLMLALAEGVARTRGFGHAVLYRADPVVGYYPSPNQNLARYGGNVRTNQFGMRSQPIEPTKAPGDFRILMLGDSTQWGGSYVDQSDVYSTRIQTALNGLEGPGKVEILAIGANGWGPFHEHGYVRKFGTFDADVAIINLPMDDVNRTLYGLMDAPFFGDVNPPTFALEEFLGNLTWRYRKSHAGFTAKWEEEQSPIGIAEYGHLADTLHASAVSEVYGAVLPGRSGGFGGPKNESSNEWFDQLRDTFSAHHVVTTYPNGLFAGKGTPDEIYYDDVHLNPKGHEIYAGFLVEQLKAGKALQAWLAKGRGTDGAGQAGHTRNER